LLNLQSSDAAGERGVPEFDRSFLSTSRFVRPVLAFFGSASIKIVGRVGARTVTISWCDPTMCAYTDQVWDLRAASATGICSLSRLPVKQGDLVYQPRRGKMRPANAAAMIHAHLVEESLSGMMVED
jgi:hypothetical protein